MIYSEMTKNYIFRELKCGLSIEQTAELCFKSVTTVKKWDQGKTIPPECKRLMRSHLCRELHHSEQWEGFSMRGERLVLPTGECISPQQILTGVALIHIKSELELKTSRHIFKLVKAIAEVKFRSGLD